MQNKQKILIIGANVTLFILLLIGIIFSTFIRFNQANLALAANNSSPSLVSKKSTRVIQICVRECAVSGTKLDNLAHKYEFNYEIILVGTNKAIDIQSKYGIANFDGYIILDEDENLVALVDSDWQIEKFIK